MTSDELDAILNRNHAAKIVPLISDDPSPAEEALRQSCKDVWDLGSALRGALEEIGFQEATMKRMKNLMCERSRCLIEHEESCGCGGEDCRSGPVGAG